MPVISPTGPPGPRPGPRRWARSRRWVAFWAALAAVLALAGPSPATAADTSVGAENLCARSIARSEQGEDIPVHLLTAISLAESGRRDPRGEAIIAWPWTVTAEGRGRFYENREDAIAAVKRLRARGVTNIDVGCMQVNLYYHADAFADLEGAFDPARNVTYAARFLKRLWSRTRSWSRAISLYHSATRLRGRDYRSKVFRLWTQARRQAAAVRRQAVIDAYLERRAAQEARRAAKRPTDRPS